MQLLKLGHLRWAGRLSLALLLSLFLIACSGEAEKGGTETPVAGPKDPNQMAPPETTPPVVEVEKGLPIRQLLTGFTLKNDPQLAVSLYIPDSSYAGTQLPLLLAFDSHARGEMVLEKYRELADRFGFVLAVSENSKNGHQPDQSLQIANSTLDDLMGRLNLDPKRLVLTGFSGGARVACLVAQNRTDIAGVIGCAAGYQPDVRGQSFSYYGLVGVEDFNYVEMISLDRVLESISPPYWIETWKGPHEWPPVEDMEKAWDWMEFRQMAYETLPKDEERIGAMKSRFEKAMASCKGTDCYDLRKEYHSYLREIEDVEALKAEMRQISSEQGFRDQRDRQQAAEAREAGLRETCQHDIQVKDLAYWQQEVPAMEKRAKPKTEEGYMHRRVLGFMSLVAYSYSNQSLAANDLANAEKYIIIYALVDPPNSEHAYFLAKLRMRQGRSDEAMSSLIKAVALGFSDKDRMASDPDFVTLKGAPGFENLLNGMD